MKRTAEFEYYYGKQAEEYSFYRIPKVLFTDPFFRKLSCEAKTLYGLMLDRMSLSVRNNWFDEMNRVYIIFTVEDVCEMMGCCRQKAVKMMEELDSQKGIGLIEKKRRGLGKPNIIYVKNFMLREEPGNTPVRTEGESDEATDTPETLDSTQKSKNHTSGSLENRIQEVQKSYFRKSADHTSGSLENGLLEVYKTDCNNTDNNKTDMNETDKNPSNQSNREDGMRYDPGETGIYQAFQDLIKENIEYDTLCRIYEKEDVDGIVDLMTDTVCSKRKRIIIAGEPVPLEIAKGRLLKLGQAHIEYVFECMKKNTTKVRNIRQYLLTTLYNAPSTIGHYYSAEVNSDLYGTC